MYIGDFIVVFVMIVCKKILFVDILVKIGLYFVGVVIGLVLVDMI